MWHPLSSGRQRWLAGGSFLIRQCHPPSRWLAAGRWAAALLYGLQRWLDFFLHIRFANWFHFWFLGSLIFTDQWIIDQPLVINKLLCRCPILAVGTVTSKLRLYHHTNTNVPWEQLEHFAFTDRMPFNANQTILKYARECKSCWTRKLINNDD